MLSDDHDWNPLLYIGDLHLRTFMSSIHNETSWGQKFRTYKEREFQTPLPLRAESSNPIDIFHTWHRILYCPSYKNMIIHVREESYKEYEKVVETIGKLVMGYLSQRWNSLTDELKQVEPHSLQNYATACKRVDRYIQIGRMR